MKCPDCGKRMVLDETNPLKKIFRCSNATRCQVTHLADKNGNPRGFVGDKETRKHRIIAHRYFDKLWKPEDATMTRGEAYQLLMELTGLSQKEAHISKFSINQCKELVKKIKEHQDKNNVELSRNDSTLR